MKKKKLKTKVVYHINVDKVNQYLDYYVSEGISVNKAINLIAQAVKEGRIK